MDGPGPGERIVGVRGIDRTHEVVASAHLASVGEIAVGVISADESVALIELPAESADGSWRIRVPASSVQYA